MKKKYLLAEFIIVFLILVLPPLFVSYGENTVVSLAGIPWWYLLIQLISAVLLDLSIRAVSKETSVLQEDIKIRRFSKLVTFLKWFSLTLGLLLVTYALMEGLYLLFPSAFPDSSAEKFILPQKAGEFVYIVFTLLVSAYYEEVLYREFLPESLSIFLSRFPKIKLLLEALVIAIFAFSHRYEGLLAVINAAISGVILRLCMKKTKSVYTGALAHFVYNLIQLLFLFTALT